jgi:RHS repeat-associated protein
LTKVIISQANLDYTYDANGNLIQETTSRHFEWDHADRMRVFRTQAGTAEPSVHTHYLYNAGGQRVKKLVRKQGGKVEVTVYVDGIFEHQRIVQGAAVQQNNTLHVMDDGSRIALVRAGAPFSADTTPAVKFQLGDHLGSNNLVLDGAGALVNREEYTPYGETSFGSFARKRYRFTGKERDEESGFYYHGARYYAPWLARWTNCDPAGMVDGANLYSYTLNNPLRLIDPTGTTSSGPRVSDASNVVVRDQGSYIEFTEAEPLVGNASVNGQKTQGGSPPEASSDATRSGTSTESTSGSPGIPQTGKGAPFGASGSVVATGLFGSGGRFEWLKEAPLAENLKKWGSGQLVFFAYNAMTSAAVGASKGNLAAERKSGLTSQVGGGARSLIWNMVGARYPTFKYGTGAQQAMDKLFLSPVQSVVNQSLNPDAVPR